MKRRNMKTTENFVKFIRSLEIQLEKDGYFIEYGEVLQSDGVRTWYTNRYKLLEEFGSGEPLGHRGSKLDLLFWWFDLD